MPKLFKYTLRAIAIFIGIILLLYLIVFIYVSVKKKSIIKEVTEEISKKINGTVSIGDVELSFFRSFPKVSVLLHEVSVTDTLFAKHHHAIFQAEEVFANLSIIELAKKQSPVNGIKIEKASVYLFTDTSGYTNAYLLKPKTAAAAGNKEKSSGNNNLESVELKEVRITVDDRLKEKLYDFAIQNLKVKLNDEAKETIFSVKANVLVNSLAFNLPNGSFVKGKKFEGDFDFRFNKKLEQLQFDSIDIKLSSQPFNITATFDLVKPEPQFTLKVYTHNISYDFGKSLLTDKIATALSIVNLDKKFDINAAISGPLNGGDPLIFVNWKVKNSKLTTPFLDFDDASFTGYYTDEVIAGQPRRDPNSKISVSNFTATWHTLPLTSGHIEILNLYEPVLTCDLSAAFPLIKLNDLLGEENSIQLQSGNGAINVTYKGPLEKNNNTNSFINGTITFADGNILYAPRDVELKNVNGNLAFKNSDVLINNIQCNVLNNKIVMNGQAKNLLSLMSSEPNKANIDWNIYSPSLNLSSFIYLLQSRKSVAKKASKNSLNNFASKIDNVLEQGSVDVYLKADRLSYKKFEATNALANVTLLPDRYIINNVSMNQAGGNINLSGALIMQKENYHAADLNVTLNNVDVNKVFAAFNNFGQDGIKAQNLEGKLFAKVNASLALDNNGKAYPKTVKSIIDFSLKNGALNNFEPLKKIQSFIFKNRDFDNIRFAELKDRLEVANQDIKINRMEIESNVLSMFVEGVYSMKGNTDISIQVPLSNLKKRNKDYKPVNRGVNSKTGASIYIKGVTGADGNIQFKPEIFHLFK